MDELLIQRTRYILRSRVRRMQTSPDALFIASCHQLLAWINSHPILSTIVEHLEKIPGDHNEHVDKIIREAPSVEGSYDPGRYSARTSDEHAALCLKIVQGISKLEKLNQRQLNFTIRCLREYIDGNDSPKFEEALQVLRDVAVDGLYEYLDEQVDTRNAIYSILLKYKQRTEWFRKVRLRFIADNGLEGRQGERALAIDLQEYVLDQGVEFFVEPASISGEADLVLRAPETRYIILDAKYIPESANRSAIRDKLASGFNQVSRYCTDYSEPEGFLVAFNRSSTNVRLELENSDGFPFLTLGGKTIYYLEVDIADLPSASKSGKAAEVVIKADELKYLEE